MNNNVWFSSKIKINNEKLSIVSNFINHNYGYYNQLLVRGVGYKIWKHKDKILGLDLGFTHFITVSVPSDIEIIPKKIRLVLFSKNKQLLNSFCQSLKDLKFPDAYKGKGIRFSSDNLVLKTGKVKN